MSLRPLFVLSISRSGSTLLQRVLSGHPQVATVSEPWFLLPPLSASRPGLPGGPAWQRNLSHAIEDLAATLPDGPDSYRAAVRELALRLYGEAAPAGTRWFVDKTPTYFAIAEELFATFPDAEFVFLWRNPLAAIASMCDSWHGGRFELHDHRRDLFDGIPTLLRAQQRHGDRALSVRFEDLVRGDEEVWGAIAARLGIELDREDRDRWASVRLGGRMGDRHGSSRYTALSTEPLEKWRSTLASPLRRRWCERYLRWLGDERLASMGYDGEELRAELGTLSSGGHSLAADARALSGSMLRELASARSAAPRISSWRELLGA